MNIAEQILHGADEIDWKRKKIERLVKMLLDSLNKEEHFCDNRAPQEIVFYPQGLIPKWNTRTLRWYVYHVGCDLVYLVCKDKEGTMGDALYRSDNNKMSAFYVTLVYDTLPILAEGMMKTFPEVKRNMYKFIEAGKL